MKKKKIKKMEKMGKKKCKRTNEGKIMWDGGGYF